jgi:hypothetical protein
LPEIMICIKFSSDMIQAILPALSASKIDLLCLYPGNCNTVLIGLCQV